MTQTSSTAATSSAHDTMTHRTAANIAHRLPTRAPPTRFGPRQGMAGPHPAAVFTPRLTPTVRGTGRALGLITGCELLDGPLGGLRSGGLYVLRSPGDEAVQAARALVAAAERAGASGVVVDPATLMRHAAPERAGAGACAWAVERPVTIEALALVTAEQPAVGDLHLVVVTAPDHLLRGRDRKAQARFSRWSRELAEQARSAGSVVVFVAPWSGPLPGRAWAALDRTADTVVRLEAIVGGGMAARNVTDGRLRVVDARGLPDAERERRAHAVALPWAFRGAH